MLHLKGRNVEENQFVKMGAYHTLDLIIDQKFTITKSEWDSVAVMLVEQAADPTQQADLAAVIMHEGLAYVCLITSTTTIVRAKIEMNIPRKRTGLPTAQHDKGMTRFFEQIMQALERHIRFDSKFISPHRIFAFTLSPHIALLNAFLCCETLKLEKN